MSRMASFQTGLEFRKCYEATTLRRSDQTEGDSSNPAQFLHSVDAKNKMTTFEFAHKRGGAISTQFRSITYEV